MLTKESIREANSLRFARLTETNQWNLIILVWKWMSLTQKAKYFTKVKECENWTMAYFKSEDFTCIEFRTDCASILCVQLYI